MSPTLGNERRACEIGIARSLALVVVVAVGIVSADFNRSCDCLFRRRLCRSRSGNGLRLVLRNVVLRQIEAVNDVQEFGHVIDVRRVASRLDGPDLSLGCRQVLDSGIPSRRTVHRSEIISRAVCDAVLDAFILPEIRIDEVLVSVLVLLCRPLVVLRHAVPRRTAPCVARKRTLHAVKVVRVLSQVRRAVARLQCELGESDRCKHARPLCDLLIKRSDLRNLLRLRQPVQASRLRSSRLMLVDGFSVRIEHRIARRAVSLRVFEDFVRP